MAVSTVLKHFTDGTITLEDGTSGTPVTLTVPFSQGDFSISGIQQAAQKAVNVYQSRGVLHSIRLGEKTFITGSFSAMLADVSDSAAGNLLDFIRKSNAYSSNASTLGSGDAYLIKITLEIDGTSLGDSANHTIVLDDCACTADVSEGEPDSISISFTSYADPVMT
jgi:hypothetical protein